MVMLAIVGRSDLCQQSCNHLDDVCDRHVAYLVLWPNICRISPLTPRQRARLGEWTGLIDGKALDMGKACDLDLSRRRGVRFGWRAQRLCW
jgi:hypothetical protein